MSQTLIRRQFLVAGAALAIVIVAGCSKPAAEGQGQVEQPEATTTQIEEPVERDLPFGLPGRYVDSREIRKLLSDKTFYGTYFNLSHSVEYYAPDGTAQYRWGESLTCRGQWYVVRDYACFHYPSLHAGGDSCFQLAESPFQSRLKMIPSGRYQEDAFTVRKIEPGDAEGLTKTSSSTCE